MILQTHENWEIREPLFKAFDPPGTRRYAMVEIALNVPLFWLDAAVVIDADEEPLLWQTFLLTSFDDVQAFLSANTITDHRIRLLPPHATGEQHEFAISTITEVYVGTAPNGGRYQLFVCTNGRRYMDAFGFKESELTDKVRVYAKTLPPPAVGDDRGSGEENWGDEA